MTTKFEIQIPTLQQKLNRLLVTWFGCGYFPKAPGTAGSVGALPICWIVSSSMGTSMRIIVALFATAVACLTSAYDQAHTENRDPQYIVIDEVAGMLWSTVFTEASIAAMFLSFLLFRIFDVLKPFPANIIDRASKTVSSTFARGSAIVFDDVIAGLYTALIMRGLIVYYAPSWL